MPSIPLVSRSAIPATQIASRVDGDAFMAPGRAISAAGQAITQAAVVGAEFALRKQHQVNRGILANEETVRMETAAQIQSYISTNPDKPDTWGKFSNDTWKGYEQGRATRMKDQKWSPSLAAEDTVKYQSYRAETGVHFRAAQDKAFIRQSNARLEANAQTKLRAGDYEGFVSAMDQMNLFPDQREEAIRRGLEEGMYKVANNQLDAIHELPPARAIEAYDAYLADLKAKGADGRFANYEFDRGGLSLGGRVNLESIANARIREAQRQMDITGRRLVGELRLGRATTADVAQALKDGELDEATARVLAPDIGLAQEELATKKAAKAQEIAQQQERKTGQIREDALKRGDVGLREIERQLALGEISPDQADKLKSELTQAARAEQLLAKGVYRTISDDIKGGFGAKLAGRQPSDKEYQRILSDITSAKVTKETRLKLMDELFALKLADLEDLEEEGPDDGRWMDRDISTNERTMRRELVKSYRQLLPALGDLTAGDLMLSQEKAIRSFFDASKQPPTAEQVDKFMREKLLPEVQQAAGFHALKDAFDF